MKYKKRLSLTASGLLALSLSCSFEVPPDITTQAKNVSESQNPDKNSEIEALRQQLEELRKQQGAKNNQNVNENVNNINIKIGEVDKVLKEIEEKKADATPEAQAKLEEQARQLQTQKETLVKEKETIATQPVVQPSASPIPLPTSSPIGNGQPQGTAPTPSTGGSSPVPTQIPSPTLEPTPTPLPIPIAPSGLAKDNLTSTSFTLKWESVTEAESYKVYKNGTKVASNIIAHNYNVVGLAPGSSSSMEVSAVNASGESAKSSVLQHSS